MPRFAEPNATQEKIIKFIQEKLGEDWEYCNPHEIIPKSDFKVIFNFENFIAPWNSGGENRKEVGWYEVNGTTIALCCAGGDWEYPVYFAVYLERGGKKLRAYVPTIGNCFDIYCKTALGSQGEFGDIDPDDVWPDDLRDDDDRVYDWERYLHTLVNVEDMLGDIGARIEGAKPVVPFKKKHRLKYDAKALDAWLEENPEDE